jgi:hypothetical protein
MQFGRRVVVERRKAGPGDSSFDPTSEERSRRQSARRAGSQHRFRSMSVCLLIGSAILVVGRFGRLFLVVIERDNGTITSQSAFSAAPNQQYQGACHGYSGVLHISQGDVEGAAGTIFFLFVLNQLMYAEKHNLIPWIHMDDVSHYVYDTKVHGEDALPPQERNFSILQVVNASWINYIDPTSQQRYPFAGRPVKLQTHMIRQWITVKGNGVWTSYFEPVSNFSPLDESCTSLPLIHLTHSQIVPGLHVHCPWSLRAWRYGGLPPGLRRDELSYQDWFAPMRQRGNELLQKYVRPQPYLQQAADQANPTGLASSHTTSGRCLALHIRHSDKANRRKRIAVKTFLPYVKIYVEEQLRFLDSPSSYGSIQNGREQPQYTNPPFVYLATDSDRVIQEIQTTWPANLVQFIHWQTQVVRSNDTTPVFTLTSSHHVTNVQVLVDILAMSKCKYLLHGLSAVSEATHYFNPILHNQSINLDVQRGGRNTKKHQSRDLVVRESNGDLGVSTFLSMLQWGAPTK